MGDDNAGGKGGGIVSDGYGLSVSGRGMQDSCRRSTATLYRRRRDYNARVGCAGVGTITAAAASATGLATASDGLSGGGGGVCAGSVLSVESGVNGVFVVVVVAGCFGWPRFSHAPPPNRTFPISTHRAKNSTNAGQMKNLLPNVGIH